MKYSAKMYSRARFGSITCVCLIFATGCTLILVQVTKMSPVAVHTNHRTNLHSKSVITGTDAGLPLQTEQQHKLRYALAIHGGAGVINSNNTLWLDAAMQGLQRSLDAGQAVLRAGGAAVDAVVAAVVVLENDPHFNAGEHVCSLWQQQVAGYHSAAAASCVTTLRQQDQYRCCFVHLAAELRDTSAPRFRPGNIA